MSDEAAFFFNVELKLPEGVEFDDRWWQTSFCPGRYGVAYLCKRGNKYAWVPLFTVEMSDAIDGRGAYEPYIQALFNRRLERVTWATDDEADVLFTHHYGKDWKREYSEKVKKLLADQGLRSA